MMNRRAFFGMAAGAVAAAGGLGCSRAKETLNRIKEKISSADTGKVKVAALQGHTDAVDGSSVR